MLLLQDGAQFKLWAGIDPRPGLGYRVIAREVIPAGSFVYEYAGKYLPVSPHVVTFLRAYTMLHVNSGDKCTGDSMLRWWRCLAASRLKAHSRPLPAVADSGLRR